SLLHQHPLLDFLAPWRLGGSMSSLLQALLPIGACIGSASASVDVLSIALNAACSVCHGRIAHFTRVGRSLTPANTVRRPSLFGCAVSSLPVAMSRNSRISSSASPRVLP